MKNTNIFSHFSSLVSWLKSVALMVLLSLSVGNAWATVSTLTFTAKCNGSGTADDGAAWTVTSDGSESNYDQTKGIHYGTSSGQVQYITLSTSDISGTITKVVVNASTASGVSATVSVTVGGNAFGGSAQSLTTSAANYTFEGSAAGEIVVTITKPSRAAKAIYCKSIAVTYSSGGSSDPSITSTTSSMSFSAESGSTDSKSFTFSAANLTANVELALSGDNSALFSLSETSVNKGSGTITDQSITVTYSPTAAGTHSATLTLTSGTASKAITLSGTATAPAAKYTVSFNVGASSGSQADIVETTAGAGITLPSGPTPTCSADGWSFEGWAAAAVASSTTTAPTLFAANTIYKPTSNCTLYAVYSKTETTGGGSSNGSKTFTFSDIASANSWENSIAYTPVVIAPVTITANGGGNNGKWYTSGGGSWRMYSGGTVNITVDGGSVTSVTSSPSTSFTISNGEASFSPTARTDYTEITVNYTISGGATTTYYWSSPTCTACSNQVTINKGTPSNGSFDLDKTGSQDNCSAGGLVVIVSNINPAEGYEFDAITQEGISSGVTIDQNAKTVTYDKDVTGPSTINVTFKEKTKYTIRFFDNGTKVSEQSVTEDQAAVKPSDPTPCDGYSFVGWWTATLAEDNTTAQTWVTNFTATQDQDYYAVFSKTEGSGGGSGTAVFTATAQGYSNGSSAGTKIIDGVTFAYADGGNSTNSPKFYTSSNCVHLYPQNTLTISSENNITSIVFAFSRNDGWTASPGTWDDETTWTGDANNIVFTVGNTSGLQMRISSITVTIGGGGTTYYTTSCAPCLTKVTLSKGEETNGTFTLNKDDGEYNNCTSNFVVTVSGITPASGYHCTGVTATGGDNVAVTGPDGSGNYTVTYTKGNSITSTITANFAPNPKYTVTWSMDGDESNTVDYEEGESIVFPTSATGCDGKTFMGWTAAALDAPQDDAPTYVTSATMPAHAVTYYAVYADEETGSGSGSGTWSEAAIGTLTSLDIFVIVGNNGSSNYALPNSGTPPAVSSVTIEEGNITSTVNDGLKWNISGNSTDGYTFYPNGSTTSWLYCSTTADSKNNENIRVGTGGRNVWLLSEDQLVTNDSYVDRYLAIQAATDFRSYVLASTSTTTFKFYKYSAGGSGTTYSNYATSCGAGISAKNIGWITAAKGQKVKRVINVYAKGFDEATTLTATSGNAQFTATLAASDVPAGKTGLNTTLTVEYTPTASSDRIENVEITLSAGGMTKTITVSGRSVPEEFLLITKKNTTWYALPANMTSGPGEYDGVTVVPNNPDGTPTAVAVSPSTIIYSLTSNVASRYTDAGNCVRLVGNDNLCLWSNLASTTGKTNIQNKTGVSGNAVLNNEWLLSTTDGHQYTIANPNHPHYPSRRLAYGEKFGLYEESTIFYIVEAGCTSQPGDVNVSPRRAEATFSWESNASSVEIAIYTDNNLTDFVKSETATSQPYVMKGLTEETNYWFKLIPAGEDACAVIGSFKTTGPTIDIAEWQEDAVVVQIDHGDIVPSIIIDGQEEHGSITGGGGTATELFFAKYFEGAGSMKLVSIFNGTTNNINLSQYSIYVRMRGGSGSWSPDNDVDLDLGTLGSIKAGQEIIFFSRPLGTETALDGCSSSFLDDKVENSSSAESNPRWVECDGTTFQKINFNGNDPILLKKNGTLIDIIGSQGTAPTATNCLSGDSEKGWAGTVRNMDKGKSPSDPVFDAFYDASTKSPVTRQDSINLLTAFGINLDDEEIAITTARCILFRDKRVTSGDSAVLMNETNGSTFVTFTNHDEFKSEWYGRSVCMNDAAKTAAGVSNDAQATCNSYQDIANMDYNEYYIDYTSHVIPEQTLNPSWKDEETNLYTIPIPDMEKYTCLNLRFRLTKGGEVVTEVAQQVPIIISGGNVNTNDKLFSELVVDKVDEDDPTTWVPLYQQSKERCSTCDVVVLGTGSLTKVADSDSKDVPEVGNIKIYPGGKLIVPTGTNYSVNSLSFRRQEDVLSTANIQGNLNIKEDGNNVFFDLRVDPSNWHYIALPYDCNVADIRFVNDDEKIPVLGTDYLLKYYDGEKRAATQAGGCWEMVAANATLKKGIGYIFGIPGDGKVQREFRFPMSNEVVTEEKASSKQANGVYAYGGDKTMTEVRANHRGWNLLGNPYLLPYMSDIENPVMTGKIVPDYPEDPEEKWNGHYKFDPDPATNLRYIVEPVDNGRSEYKQVAITDYEMKPFTSYFVQIGGDDPDEMQGVQFNLSKVDRSASPVRRSPASYEEAEDNHPVWVTINITNDKGEKDETTMLISNDFTNGYDMMDDLVKMRGTYYQYASVTTKPVLASRNDEGEMAFNALPDLSAKAGVPLNYFAAANGQYKIALDGRYSLEEVKEVQLYDSELAAWHDLMTEDYVFTAKKGNNTTRFTLYVTVERKQPQTPTDTDDLQGKLTLTTADKTLMLSGLRDDADIYVYDMSGKLIASDRHTSGGENGVWRTTVATQGVYFVRVMTGTEQHTLNTIVY